MTSYVKFRDIPAVLRAGASLTTTGAEFANRASGAIARIVGQEKTALTGSDEYATTFREAYHKPFNGKARDEALLAGAHELTTHTQEVGPSVVKAASTLAAVDSADAVNIARAATRRDPA